jgi:hypothetical protein
LTVLGCSNPRNKATAKRESSFGHTELAAQTLRKYGVVKMSGLSVVIIFGADGCRDWRGIVLTKQKMDILLFFWPKEHPFCSGRTRRCRGRLRPYNLYYRQSRHILEPEQYGSTSQSCALHFSGVSGVKQDVARRHRPIFTAHFSPDAFTINRHRLKATGGIWPSGRVSIRSPRTSLRKARAASWEVWRRLR